MNLKTLLCCVLISSSAFSSAQNLQNIIFNSGLSKIGRFAFRYAGVKKVTIPGSVNTFDTAAFRDSKTLENINLESGIKKTIGFIRANYDRMEELIIPSTITELNAFGGCENLTQVTFENNSQLEVIGDGCFSACGSLHQINIPESVKKIREYAFISTQIQHLNFPNVESIGDYAFDKVEFIQIGHKVKSIVHYKDVKLSN